MKLRPRNVDVLGLSSQVLCRAGKMATSYHKRHYRLLQYHNINDLKVNSLLCSELLTGAFQQSGGEFAEAAQLSMHQGTKGFGRLDPLAGACLHR